MTSKHEVNPYDEMLSGWKDIANYMGKGVRTVQRYERDLGLPVRRLSGGPRGAVIATKSDVDFWVRSSATAQESINRSQKALNVAQDSFNKQSRRITDYLVSEIANEVRRRTELETQMTELRKELQMSVSKVRENLLKLRQQVNEIRQRQDVIASVIRDHSKGRALLYDSGKRQKPN